MSARTRAPKSLELAARAKSGLGKSVTGEKSSSGSPIGHDGASLVRSGDLNVLFFSSLLFTVRLHLCVMFAIALW